MCLGTGLGIATASIPDGVGWSAMSYEKMQMEQYRED